MNSWNTEKANIPARRKATWLFCQYLDDPKNDGERQNCKKDSDTARKLFARLGEFYLEEDGAPAGFDPIPLTTKFYVFDDDPHDKRDTMVTIVLPNRGALPIEAEFEATRAYRCTYEPYK
jgi:hypothetical protein